MKSVKSSVEHVVGSVQYGTNLAHDCVYESKHYNSTLFKMFLQQGKILGKLWFNSILGPRKYMKTVKYFVVEDKPLLQMQRKWFVLYY